MKTLEDSKILDELFKDPRKDLLLSDEETEKFYAYGYAHYGTGNWAEAADVFRVLCTRRPLESRFWFALGATLQEAGTYKDSLHAWAMAALLDKPDPYPHFHAAECCFSLGWKEDGGKALAEAADRIQKGHPLEGKIALLKERWDGN